MSLNRASTLSYRLASSSDDAIIGSVKAILRLYYGSIKVVLRLY